MAIDIPRDFLGKGISDVPSIVMKPTENSRGKPLIGAAVKVADGLFWTALSAAESDVSVNLDLLESQDWIDLPLVYETGQRAILAFGKGTDGEQVFREAMAAWGTPQKEDFAIAKQSNNVIGDNPAVKALSGFLNRLKLSVLMADCQSGGCDDPVRVIRSCSTVIGAPDQSNEVLSDAYTSRGAAEEVLGKFDQSLADLDEAVQLNPLNPRPRLERGYTHQSMRNYDQAIADYTEAIRLRPTYALAYCDRSGAYGEAGNWDRSLADADEAIRLDGSIACAYINRGMAYSNKGTPLERSLSTLKRFDSALRGCPALC